MQFIRAGEYAINLDLVASCRRHSDSSIQIRFIGVDGTLALSGNEAQIVWNAALGKPN
jgi:hypothetical protein